MVKRKVDFLAYIDTYRENLANKNKELLALQEEKTKQDKKNADLVKKIDKTKKASQSSKSETALKSSLNAIRRLEKNNNKIKESIKKINKEIIIEQKKISKEELK